MKTKNPFQRWLGTFLDEKGIDEDQILVVDGKYGPNLIPVGFLLSAIAICPHLEQEQIKHALVDIDFRNGDVLHYLQHLAKAIAI